MAVSSYERYAASGNTSDVPSDTPRFLIPVDEIIAVLQGREFLENRYYRSQEHGYNVGDLYTMMHWVESGLAARFREKVDANIIPIQRFCAQHCVDTCKVFDIRRLLKRKNGMCEQDLALCPMSKDEMHDLLHDS